MAIRTIARCMVAAVLSFALWSGATASAAEPTWDLPTRLVDEPAGIARLRAQYATMTEAQLVAAGFQVDAAYITAAMVGLPPSTGAMGYHAINPTLMNAQFSHGTMDPDHPPVILLGPDKRVIGVEWETANKGVPPQIYDQIVNLGPPHPGVDQPHFMLHAYFQPNGKVLFGDFNPALTAPGLPNTGAGGSQRSVVAAPGFVALALAVACTIAMGLVLRRTARRR
ncbi:MAG: hypothetical protein U0232_06130 [Thermomicrobiales bacterium]